MRQHRHHDRPNDDRIDQLRNVRQGFHRQWQFACGQSHGSLKSDTLLGGDGADFISDAASFVGDTLDGGLGSDTLDYAASFDAVNVNLATNAASGGGASGDMISNFENLTGSAFADTLTGSSLANIIKGGDGNDAILGGAGADQINGGGGVDVLTGEGGPDRFNYTAVTESGIGVGSRDIITDFLVGTDKINVSQLDANAIGGTADDSFTFIATRGAAFTGAPGEIKFFTQNGNTVVAFNLNADTVAEFQIELTGIVDPTAGDFIL